MKFEQCKNVDDVVKFLVHRLIWIPEPPTQLGWTQQFGYRCAYYNQQVWYHAESGRYAFHSDKPYWNPKSEPNLGMYNTFHSLLEGVAEKLKTLADKSAPSNARYNVVSCKWA